MANQNCILWLQNIIWNFLHIFWSLECLLTLNLPQERSGAEKKQFNSEFFILDYYSFGVGAKFFNRVVEIAFRCPKNDFWEKKIGQKINFFFGKIRISFFSLLPVLTQTYALWGTNFESLVGTVSTRPEENFVLFYVSNISRTFGEDILTNLRQKCMQRVQGTFFEAIGFSSIK